MERHPYIALNAIGMNVEGKVIPQCLRGIAFGRTLANRSILIVVEYGPEVLAGVVLVPLADADCGVVELGGRGGEGHYGHLWGIEIGNWYYTNLF